jgi:hypothetical protein
MKFRDGLFCHRRQIFNLIARLRNRITRMAHLSNKFLRRLCVFAQTPGGLFENAQHLPHASLLFPLHVCERSYAFTTHP